jgi:predicted RNase H-like HicB family nuclease
MFEWSEEDQEHVALCAEIPGLSGLGATRAEAVAELEESIRGWLAHLKDEGLPIPAPHRRIGGHIY